MKEANRKAMFSKGQKVRFSESALDNDGYEPEINGDKVFIVTHVATNEKEHRGFDSSMDGQALYDLKDAKTNKDFHSSLYDYELKKA